MSNRSVEVLAPGKVYIDYGPVSMVIQAQQKGAPLTELCTAAFEVIERALKEIAEALPFLRQPASQIGNLYLAGLPGKMVEAVLAVGEPTLTPMATVAGAVSDEVADWLVEHGASRVIVNNGGDIALRLSPGEKVRLGLGASLEESGVEAVVSIGAEDGIGGVATSGFGGRSLTRGIAKGVSVFSKKCILADALATHLANQTYVPGPEIKRVKAGTLDPCSDIADLDVVVSVGALSHKEIEQSLDLLLEAAAPLYEKALFVGLRANVQNCFISYPESFDKRLSKGAE